MSGPAPRVVVVTGLSGAGRSSALAALEDLGFEAVDNLPLSLLPAVVAGDKAQLAKEPRPLAVGVDIRTRDFTVATVQSMVAVLAKELGSRLSLLFLTADAETLQRRYTETRRRHPLAVDRPLADGLVLERRLMAPLRDLADEVLDTSGLTLQGLRVALERLYGDATPGQGKMLVVVTAFSFRRGLPRDADLVFDVRFLRNPHYVEALRPMTGEDGSVVSYVKEDADFQGFFGRLTALLSPLLPRYAAEGKSYLTIAVGCTGGRHRSVVVARLLAGWLAARGVDVDLRHRELAGITATPLAHAADAAA